MIKKIYSFILFSIILLIPNVVFAENSDQYEKTYANLPRVSLYSAYNDKSNIELMNDSSGYISEYRLKKKTGDKFEIALAKKDGKYIFKGSADSMSMAKNKLKSINKSSDENVVIINNDGIIEYSDMGIARIIKHINGQVDSSNANNTNIYTNKDLKSAYTYVNHGYIDDVPIKGYSDNAVEIEVAGYTGWVNNNVVSGNYDLVIVPLSQVNNPSYYYVKDGELFHFISKDVTSNFENGYSISNGKAPGFLKPNEKYYSYDGNYFYKSLRVLLTDLQNSNHSNSINDSSPYYNYYQFLPFRSKSRYTAGELDKFIDLKTKPDSKLRNIGKDLIYMQDKYGVNATLMLGVAINESGWGTSWISQNKNNIFGIRAYDSNPGEDSQKFNTVRDCIEEFAKSYISTGYSDPYDYRHYGGFLGNKNLGANVKYASDPYWGEKAAKFATLLDITLSGNINMLKGTNYYQLGIVQGENEVYDSKSSRLYNIKYGKQSYSGIVGSTFIINDSRKTIIGNKVSYEINPERTDSVNSNGKYNRFNGIYDWQKKSYINANNIRLINSGKNIENPDLTNEEGVKYQVQGQDYGWQEWTYNGRVAGVVGEAKRIEALKINKLNLKEDISINYRSFVEGDREWRNWVRDGEISGTVGESKRIEGIQIKLDGKDKFKFNIEYRVHMQDYGWLPWVKNGDISGKINSGKRIEGIEIKLTRNKNIGVQYQVQGQDYGWQEEVRDGELAGTQGKNKRIEAISLNLYNKPEGMNIEYRSKIEGKSGFEAWKRNGEYTGSVGLSKRLEKLQIQLTGNQSEKYSVKYRVHVQDYGWMPWLMDGDVAGVDGKRIEAIEVILDNKKEIGIKYQVNGQDYGVQKYVENGEIAGTVGQRKRAEGIKIELINNPRDLKIFYKVQGQDYGWQDWVESNKLAGTIGNSKRMEAIQIKLLGYNCDKYNIVYRVQCEDIGWMPWVKNGEVAGTVGKSKSIEAIQIKLEKA